MPRKKNVPDEQARKEGKPMAATEKDFTRITLKDREGNVYTLEFNARVVKSMERKGFKMDTEHPLTMIEDLFLGAFQMHHKGIMPDQEGRPALRADPALHEAAGRHDERCRGRG